MKKKMTKLALLGLIFLSGSAWTAYELDEFDCHVLELSIQKLWQSDPEGNEEPIKMLTYIWDVNCYLK